MLGTSNKAVLFLTPGSMRQKSTSFFFFTLVLDLHVTYKLAHIYDHITKLCKQKADVVQNHENTNVQNKE